MSLFGRPEDYDTHGDLRDEEGEAGMSVRTDGRNLIRELEGEIEMNRKREPAAAGMTNEELRKWCKNVAIGVYEGMGHQSYTDDLAAAITHVLDELDAFRTIVADIESIRNSEGNSVEILCDDPEADSVDKQSAIQVCCDFTDWEPRRYYAKTWTDALQQAAGDAQAWYGREDDGSDD